MILMVLLVIPLGCDDEHLLILKTITQGSNNIRETEEYMIRHYYNNKFPDYTWTNRIQIFSTGYLNDSVIVCACPILTGGRVFAFHCHECTGSHTELRTIVSLPSTTMSDHLQSANHCDRLLLLLWYWLLSNQGNQLLKWVVTQSILSSDRSTAICLSI